MKYINKFQTTSEFESKKEQLNDLENYVVYDDEKKKVHLKEIVVNNSEIVGDIVMYDKQGSKMIHCKPSEYSQETYPDAQYPPIGIVVIPSSHTDDGKNVIMSLAAMSAKTPDTGITDLAQIEGQGFNFVYLRFGGEGRQLSGFNKNGKMPYIASCPKGSGSVVSKFGDLQFDVISENMSQANNYRACVFSNNQLKGITNPNNPNEGYDTNGINTMKGMSKVLLIPSPYTSDGNKNSQYFQTPKDGGNNILADFDGLAINKKYLEQIEGDEDWKTSPTINNESNAKNFPYIQCCWRYHTEGTNQGDWYAPSASEVGYVCAKFAEIQAGYAKMKEANKTFIDLADAETTPISYWVSNYNSDTYGFGFKPSFSTLLCFGDHKGGSIYFPPLSLAFCRVSL